MNGIRLWGILCRLRGLSRRHLVWVAKLKLLLRA